MDEEKPKFQLIPALLRLREMALLSETPAAVRSEAYQDAAYLEQWIIQQCKENDAREAAKAAPETPANVVPITAQKADAE